MSPAPPDSDPDAFSSLAGAGEAETTVEGSRFLAFAWPVDSEEEAEAHLEQLRDHYHDARHVCHGLRVQLGAQRIDRSNDDGEPPRTGGFPLWQILSGDDLENSLLAVVRYFGGTKLGMGGLRRAYKDAGRLAIDDAGTTVHHPSQPLSLIIPYSDYDEFCHYINGIDACSITDREFGAQITLTLDIWSSRWVPCTEELASWLQIPHPDLLDDPDASGTD